jgi:exonuclease SbcD
MLNNKIIIPGSLERVDFGEKSEDKGFYIYETNSKELKFRSNNPRPLVRTLIEVPPNTENPTEFILQNFPKEIKEAIVRIEIKISPSLKNRVMIPKLHNELENKKSFHFDIIWITSTEIEYFVLPSLMLDPLSLFSEYVSKHFEKYKYLKELREKGFEILDKALSKVDELK